MTTQRTEPDAPTANGSRMLGKGPMTLGVLGALAVGIRWWDAPALELLPIAQAVWPALALVVLVVIVLLTMLRRWLAVLALLPAAALAVAGTAEDLWRGAPLTPAAQASGPRLVVAAVNALEAQGSPDDIAHTVRERGVDVLVLLETDDALVTELRRRPELAAFTHTSGPAQGEAVQGSVILSRLPVERAVADIGPPRRGDLQQPAVFLTLPGGVRTAVFGAHPLPPMPGLADWWADELSSLRAAVQAAQGQGYRTVVAGDLNATRDHPVFRSFTGLGAQVSKPWGLNPSWPADRPVFELDHVLARGFDVLDRGRFDAAGSDHRGTWVSLAAVRS